MATEANPNCGTGCIINVPNIFMHDRVRPNLDVRVEQNPAPLAPDIHPATTTRPRSHPVLRVAVLGAGVAGLACARTLTDYGFDVTVFEKSRGPGGRTATRRVDPDLAFDHGAQYFTARHSQFARVVGTWLDRGVVAEWVGRVMKLEGGVATDTPSQQRFVGVPGMSSVAEHLAKDLILCREARIDRMSRADGSWKLTDDTGGLFGPYAYLVLSLPSPQSAALLGSHPFAAEAAGVAMAPCWAVLVAFADRLEVPWDGAFVSDSPLSWLARNSSKSGRPRGADCWVMHASPEWSAAHLEESPEAVGPQLLDACEAAVWHALPETVYCSAHRWRYSLGADPAGRAVLFDAEARLAVCGDWLSGGRVEGAFLSGTAAAGFILREVDIPCLPETK